MKQDKNTAVFWPLPKPPAGASIWPKMMGHLTGYGISHYNFQPDYFCPHIITQGQGTLKTEKGEFPLKPGDMFTLWPGQNIEYYESSHDNWQYYWMHIQGPGSMEYVKSLGLKPHSPMRPRDPLAARRLMIQIYETYRESNPPDIPNILSWMYQLLNFCPRSPDIAAAPQPLEPGQEIVSQARAFAQALLHTPINVSQIAKALGVCRTTLFRAFTKIENTTPSEFLTNLRLSRAQHLLKTTDRRLAAISRAVGFTEEKYFLKRFRQKFGITPTQFRKREMR